MPRRARDRGAGSRRPEGQGSLPPAVVLEPDEGGIAVARALRRRGLVVHVIGTKADAAAFHCRGVRAHRLPDLATHPEEWHDALTRLAAGGTVAVIPGTDRASEFVAGARDTLPASLLSFEGPGSAHLELMDKKSHYELAVSAQVAVPWTAGLDSAEDVERAASAAAEIWPLIVKPADSDAWRRVLREDRVRVARSPAELREAAMRGLDAGLRMVASAYIPGDDAQVEEAVLVRSADGTFPMAYGCHKLRQWPVGFGSAALSVAEPIRESMELARRLLDHAGFVGVAGVETKRHTVTGEVQLIETNVRVPAHFGLGDACGAEASWRTYAALVGIPLGPAPAGRSGVRMARPPLDLRAIAELRRRGELTWRGGLAGYRNVGYWGTMDLRDPGPAVRFALREARTLVRSAASRSS